MLSLEKQKDSLPGETSLSSGRRGRARGMASQDEGRCIPSLVGGGRGQQGHCLPIEEDSSESQCRGFYSLGTLGQCGLELKAHGYFLTTD